MHYLKSQNRKKANKKEKIYSYFWVDTSNTAYIFLQKVEAYGYYVLIQWKNSKKFNVYVSSISMAEILFSLYMTWILNFWIGLVFLEIVCIWKLRKGSAKITETNSRLFVNTHWRRTKVETTGATQYYETLISRLFETFLDFKTKKQVVPRHTGTP